MEKYLVIYNKSKLTPTNDVAEITAENDDEAILKAKEIAKNAIDISIMKPRKATKGSLLEIDIRDIDIIYTTKTGKVKPSQVKFDINRLLMAMLSMR